MAKFLLALRDDDPASYADFTPERAVDRSSSWLSTKNMTSATPKPARPTKASKGTVVKYSNIELGTESARGLGGTEDAI